MLSHLTIFAKSAAPSALCFRLPPRVLVAGGYRLSTPELKSNLCDGLLQTGVHVLDAAQCPTPLAYFAASRMRADAVLIVTASHNPAAHNGLKLMLGSLPTTPEQLAQIRELTRTRAFRSIQGQIEQIDPIPEYIQAVLSRWDSLRRDNRSIDSDKFDGNTIIEYFSLIEYGVEHVNLNENLLYLLDHLDAKRLLKISVEQININPKYKTLLQELKKQQHRYSFFDYFLYSNLPSKLQNDELFINYWLKLNIISSKPYHHSKDVVYKYFIIPYNYYFDKSIIISNDYGFNSFRRQ